MTTNKTAVIVDGKEIDNFGTDQQKNAIETTTKKDTHLFGNAIVFNLELMNGKTSAINVIHNNIDVSFEDIVRFMNDAIAVSNNIKAVETQAGSVRNGVFSPVFYFDRMEFERKEILKSQFFF